MNFKYFINTSILFCTLTATIGMAQNSGLKGFGPLPPVSVTPEAEASTNGNLQKLCNENNFCVKNGPAQIIYGPAPGQSGGYSAPVWMTGSFSCNNKTFLRDPSKNVPKACYVVPQARPPQGLNNLEGTFFPCSREGQMCDINNYSQFGSSLKLIYYGTDSNFVVQTAPNSAFVCGNGFFGVDPAYGQPKQCFVRVIPQWTFCANEGGLCHLPDPRTIHGKISVRYGAQERYFGPKFNTDIITQFPCTNKTFGGDPIFGVPKVCEYTVVP